MIKNIDYLLALHSVNGLGPVRLKAVLEYFSDPKLVWEADGRELTKLGIPQNVVSLLIETRKKIEPAKYLESVEKSGIKFITVFDENYPKLLSQIYDPPTILYYQGEILPLDERAVAVVGTRKVTGYGKLVTEKFSSGLAGMGMTVVSGLARGVDTEAHRAAIASGGRTLAVLGGGLKKIFPPENIRLAEKIAGGFGAVVSEFPPDHPALPGNFPARNRIISGLSLAVLVTEAAEDSGSLITARCALDQGRDVFAVPGPITSELSYGPAMLIKEGARLVVEPGEIAEELGLDKIQNSNLKGQSEVSLNEAEKKIVESLANENKHIDEVCRQLKLPAAQVSAALVKMEIAGLVKNLGGGNYTKIC